MTRAVMPTVVTKHGAAVAAIPVVQVDESGTYAGGAGGGGGGDASAANQSTQITAEQAIQATLGATTGAKVVTDANGTVQQYLRGLVSRWFDALGAGTAAAALRTTLASDDPAVATLGATSGAAVITDANGTIQQYLRGLVKRWVDALGAGTAAAALRTTLASDDPAVVLLSRPTSVARLLTAAATTNGTNVKASAGQVFCLDGYNAAATARFLKLYNKATAPTVGTDTPVRTIYLPPLSRFVLDFPRGLNFATGIGYGLTTAAADADTGALTAGDVLCLNVDYA